MTVILVILACIIGVLSWAGVSAATSGVAGICFACLLAILARIYQAGEQHRDMLRAIASKSTVPLLLVSLGCAYVPPPTAPTVAPPVVVVENPPPVLPQPPPVTLVLTASRAENFVGEGLSLRAVETSGVVLSPAVYHWTFGDGTSSTNFAGHAYQQPGSYAASVSVRDRDGRTAEAGTVVTVASRPRPPRDPPPPPPEPASLSVKLTCTPKPAGTTPTPCNVTASYDGSTVPSANVTGVDWDWGDGFTDSTAGPTNSRTYPLAGTYTVYATVTATTSGGSKTATKSTTIVVP